MQGKGMDEERKRYGAIELDMEYLPSFRYITDERYHELPEEMKDILRTGS